ncbi:MAG: L,D-transpeptidase family protein [Alphaproteobacteria bacterium]|nr:L,D-transpeptidase family protein [Alphaproteobacteria bacterium]
MRKTFKRSLLAATFLAAFSLSAQAAVGSGDTKSSNKGAKTEASAALSAGKSRFSENYVGEMKSVTARYEDTLVHIGRDYDVGFVEMRAANPSLDPWIPGAGAHVVIPTMHLLPNAAHESVVINLAEMRMFIFTSPYKPPLTFPIGIGRDGLKTPVGVTQVMRKKEDPVWTPTDRMRREDPTLPPFVEPGPDNPMGTHALYLGFQTIAIHGTNKPYGIGRRVSSGCIRMFPEDITRVYDLIPVGTKVTVVDQPIKAGWIGDRLFLEVHPTQEQAALMEREGAVPDYQMSEQDLSFIMKVAGPAVEKLDWAEIRKVVKERKGYPVPIANRAVARPAPETSGAALPAAPAAASKPEPQQKVVLDVEKKSSFVDEQNYQD